MIIVIFVTSVHGMIWNDELFQDNLKTQDIAIERVGGLDNVYVLHYRTALGHFAMPPLGRDDTKR